MGDEEIALDKRVHSSVSARKGGEQDRMNGCAVCAGAGGRGAGQRVQYSAMWTYLLDTSTLTGSLSDARCSFATCHVAMSARGTT